MEKRTKVTIAAVGAAACTATVGVLGMRAHGSKSEPAPVRDTSFTVTFTGDVAKCSFTVDGAAYKPTDAEITARRVALTGNRQVVAKCGIYSCKVSTSATYTVSKLLGFKAA